MGCNLRTVGPREPAEAFLLVTLLLPPQRRSLPQRLFPLECLFLPQGLLPPLRPLVTQSLLLTQGCLAGLSNFLANYLNPLVGKFLEFSKNLLIAKNLLHETLVLAQSLVLPRSLVLVLEYKHLPVAGTLDLSVSCSSDPANLGAAPPYGEVFLSHSRLEAVVRQSAG